MDFVSSLAIAVIEASAMAAVILIDAVILLRVFRPGRPVDAIVVRCAALLLLLLIAFSVKVVIG